MSACDAQTKRQLFHALEPSSPFLGRRLDVASPRSCKGCGARLPQRANCGETIRKRQFTLTAHRQQTSLSTHAPSDCLPSRSRGETLILVIAHPGQRAMFFYPTISRKETAHHLPFQWRLRRPRRPARRRAAARGRRLGASAGVHQQRGAPRRAARLGSKRRGGERGAVAARRRGRRDVRSPRRVRHANHVSVYHGKGWKNLRRPSLSRRF